MFFKSKSISFNPETDIPSLTGKVILVTGGSAGLGKQTVLEFARRNPAQIWLAARSVNKATAVANEIKQLFPSAPITVLELDLASFESVKTAAATVLSTSPRLDILMLNAGIMATPPAVTRDGYEIQFGTNHMGHALLTKLLLPLLIKTATSTTTTTTTTTNPAESPSTPDVRIVSLSSHGHVFLRKGGFTFSSLKTPADDMGAFERYYQSKLANVLWARQLAKEHTQLTVAAVHPGLVATQIMEGSTAAPGIVRFLTRAGKRLLTQVEQGARNQLWAAVGEGVESGEYYEPIGVKGLASEDGMDDELARRLWEWTEKELEEYLA